jgi:hypothetical protein
VIFRACPGGVSGGPPRPRPCANNVFATRRMIAAVTNVCVMISCACFMVRHRQLVLLRHMKQMTCRVRLCLILPFSTGRLTLVTTQAAF